VEVDLAAMDARRQVGAVAATARSKWAQMQADTAAKLDDLDAKLDRRADQRDAKLAARQADGVEADAADAVELAAWTVDRARLAVLDAIDTRATPTSSPSKGGGNEHNRGPRRRRAS